MCHGTNKTGSIKQRENNAIHHSWKCSYHHNLMSATLPTMVADILHSFIPWFYPYTSMVPTTRTAIAQAINNISFERLSGGIGEQHMVHLIQWLWRYPAWNLKQRSQQQGQRPHMLSDHTCLCGHQHVEWSCQRRFRRWWRCGRRRLRWRCSRIIGDWSKIGSVWNPLQLRWVIMKCMLCKKKLRILYLRLCINAFYGKPWEGSLALWSGTYLDLFCKRNQ